ncbi:MAG: hypothetical protein ACRD0P_32815, partial [Stackebrandtia sp.]
MASFATVADYEVRTKTNLTGAARDQVEAVLADLSAVIRSKLDTPPDADVARMVVVNVAHRAITNPE